MFTIHEQQKEKFSSGILFQDVKNKKGMNTSISFSSVRNKTEEKNIFRIYNQECLSYILGMPIDTIKS